MKKRIYIYQSLLALISICLCVGCFSYKTSAGKGGKNLYETFYVGDEGMQYFIKPLEFVSVENSKNSLTMDMVFRYKNSLNNILSTVNSSIFSIQEVAEPIQMTIIIDNSSETITLQDINTLFIEKKDSKIKTRVSSNISLLDLKKMFEGGFRIRVNNQEFTPTNKTKKNIQKMNTAIFSIMKE